MEKVWLLRTQKYVKHLNQWNIWTNQCVNLLFYMKVKGNLDNIPVLDGPFLPQSVLWYLDPEKHCNNRELCNWKGLVQTIPWCFTQKNPKDNKNYLSPQVQELFKEPGFGEHFNCQPYHGVLANLLSHFLL